MHRFNSDDVTLFISGQENFRYEIDPSYKANRKTQQRPEYLYDTKNYYIKYWGAVVSSEGNEADDAIGQAHTHEDTVVVSSDKDFFQLGGLIYNPVKDELYDIQNPEYFFWCQMLTGDHADNVPGVKNPAKAHHKNQPNFTDSTAKEFLAGRDKEDMKQMVQDIYFEQYGDDWFKHFDTNARLLFLRRPDKLSYEEL